LFEERDKRLKRLTASISQAQAEKLAPIRKTKVAYVNTIAKPPRDVRIRQLKHGTTAHGRPSSLKNDVRDSKHVTTSSERVSVSAASVVCKQHQQAANPSSGRESGSKGMWLTFT
jgi:transcription elongation factor B polypeptide 3